MVVITIVTQKNGETVFFDEPFPKVHFMRLVSCTLYNSWHNLTREGFLFIKGNRDDILANILKAFYNIDTLANEITKGVKEKNKIQNFEIEVNKPNCLLKIINNNQKIVIGFSKELAYLIGADSMQLELFLKKLNSPSTYFIHCDLIDKNQNFFNKQKSDLLASFDLKGNPYEKVSYDASPQQPLRNCSTDSHVNSTTLSVRDQDGELFDFNGLPLELQLEINSKIKRDLLEVDV